MKQKLIKTIEVAIIIGLCLGVASAVEIQSGTKDVFRINTTNQIYYDVIGNSSNTDGMVITQDIFKDYSNITISIDLRYKADSFTLIFFNEKKEIIYEYIYDCDDDDCDDCDDCDDEECEPERKYIEVDKYIDRIVYKEKEGNETIVLGTDESNDSFINWAKLIIVAVVMFLGGMGVLTLINRKTKGEEDEQQEVEEEPEGMTLSEILGEDIQEEGSEE